jgi:hypothetical protein
MPEEKEYSFKNWAKTLSPSFVIYGDIECILTKDDSVLQQHLPIAAAFLIVPNKVIKNIIPTYHSFLGRDCIPRFLENLEKEVEKIAQFNKKHSYKVMLPLTNLQEQQHLSASVCYFCHNPFSEKHPKIKEHCHLTGNYRGAACQPCNTRARLRRMVVPVIFHNWRGYDAHHIVKEGISTRPNWDLEVIATNSESYLNLRASWGDKECRRKISFIDSLQFLQNSLASLL